MRGIRKTGLRLNLALQGGGAHGAFTWGVLDRLLEDAEIEFGWISGTSAGAVNAIALADGLAQGGREAAREKLRAVWDAVQDAGVPDLMRFNPFFYGMSRSRTIGQMAQLFSPYEFNPLGFDPLRKLLAGHIDFARLRQRSDCELLIAATDVATGRARLFRRAEMTVEVILASACLPTLHHAVEIEGRAYWDGGFSANPELLTLASESPVQDTLLVLLNPIEVPSLPRTAHDITAGVNRVTFGAPLIRDVGEIVRVAKDGAGYWQRKTRAGAVHAHRFHMIDAAVHTVGLAPDSKMRPDRAMLASLHNAGRDEAATWLVRNRSAIGVASSVDLEATFLAPLQPLRSPPAAQEPDLEDVAEALAQKL